MLLQLIIFGSHLAFIGKNKYIFILYVVVPSIWVKT